jgi:hypothetical protein
VNDITVQLARYGEIRTLPVLHALRYQGCLTVKWGIAGDYIFNARKNMLYKFGANYGVSRWPLGWTAVDLKQVWRIWHQLLHLPIPRGFLENIP